MSTASLKSKNEESHAGVTLGGLAREMLAECEGDTAKAKQRLVAKLLTDRALLTRVLDVLVSSALNDRISSVVTGARHNTVASQGRNAVLALADGVARSLLDFQLAGGKRLRDASRQEVQSQAQLYQNFADDAGHKARWLALVAQAVPDGKTVGEVLSDERAAELFEEGRRGL